MAFKSGQRVRLNRDLQLSGFKVVKNTQGTVSNVHLQTSVLFDGLEQPLGVADNDIDPMDGGFPGTQSQSISSVAATASATGFSPGQRVRLLVTKQIGGQTIPAGSLGTVTQNAPSMNAAWVLFDGFSSDALIPNGDLAAA